jgi:outer membrane immunogenic protein
MRFVGIVIGVAALLSGLGPARAEDAAPVSEAQAAPTDWSGLFVGGNFGGGWAKRARWRNLDNGTLFGDAQPPDAFHDSAKGVVGGGQIGWNWQKGSLVLGVEALFDASGVKGKKTSPFGAADDRFSTRVSSLLLLTGRVGGAWNGWLAYAKGGYAGARVKASASDDGQPWTGSGSDRRWRSGWTAGAGVEYALTSALSLGLEYDFIRLGGKTHRLGDASGSYSWNVKPGNLNVVMAKLNYRFSTAP